MDSKTRLQDFELWGGMYGEESVLNWAEEFSITRGGVAYDDTPNADRLQYLPAFLQTKGVDRAVRRLLQSSNARCFKDIYEQLSDPWSIRVLELYAGEFADELCGALHECSVEFNLYTATLQPLGDELNDHAKFVISMHEGPCPVWYTALSYAWGRRGDNDDCGLFCHGHLLPTTPNLDVALRHLRLSGSSVMLWIDQICINQADHEEKSHQVTLMQHIYRNARNTVAWLGVGSDESRNAIDTIRLVNATLHAPNDSGTFRSANDLARMMLPAAESQRWREVRELLSRPCEPSFSLALGAIGGVDTLSGTPFNRFFSVAASSATYPSSFLTYLSNFQGSRVFGSFKRSYSHVLSS